MQLLSLTTLILNMQTAKENVLEDIDFEAKPGQTVAIIGSTGSGKSTLAKLIPRFFRCN